MYINSFAGYYHIKCLLTKFKILMLEQIAEYGDKEREVVGVISGCIKTVTRGKDAALNHLQDHVKVAYILGLRVSPTHRSLPLPPMKLCIPIDIELSRWRSF